MIETIKLEINPYTFYIKHFTNGTPFENISKSNLDGLIVVNFEPMMPLSEQDVIEVFDEYENQILIEINKILKDNDELYSNYNVPSHFYRTSYHKHKVMNRELVFRAERYLDIRLK